MAGCRRSQSMRELERARRNFDFCREQARRRILLIEDDYDDELDMAGRRLMSAVRNAQLEVDKTEDRIQKLNENYCRQIEQLETAWSRESAQLQRELDQLRYLRASWYGPENFYSSRTTDVSTWDYDRLRATINTSCDVDLLKACRKEMIKRFG